MNILKFLKKDKKERGFIMNPKREGASSRYEDKGKGLKDERISSFPAQASLLMQLARRVYRQAGRQRQIGKQGAGTSLAHKRCLKRWAVTPPIDHRRDEKEKNRGVVKEATTSQLKKVIKQIFWAFLLDAWRYDELL